MSMQIKKARHSRVDAILSVINDCSMKRLKSTPSPEGEGWGEGSPSIDAMPMGAHPSPPVPLPRGEGGE